MNLPVPVGRQYDVVYLSEDEHHVVLGTAGTGKTTMAIHRAVHLADGALRHNGRVLLVTYNNALITYLRHLAPKGVDAVNIETYFKFARGYLHSRGQMPAWNGVAERDVLHRLVAQARVNVEAQRGAFPRNTDWLIDEIAWISAMGLPDEAAYQSARRLGRQTPLRQGDARSAVWAMREEYLRLRATTTPARYDWSDLGTAVRRELAQDPTPRRYRHIVIDEGQDLSPEQIRSLVEAVEPGGSVTFFGDYHQAIYGQGMSWRAAGLQLGSRPVVTFVDNYRNTAAIARLAIALSKTPAMASGDQDLVEPKTPVAAGPPPTLVRARDHAHERQLVSAQAASLMKDRSVAILARTHGLAADAAGSLPFRALKENDKSAWSHRPGLWAGTYHSAKGLEFDAVLMPFLDDTVMPWRDTVAAYDPQEAHAREARLLYVAITRARSDLVMTYSGTLTPLLPTQTGLWLELTG